MRKALGRGLESLIPSFSQNNDEKGKIINIPIERIKANKHQARVVFSEEKMVELAESIKEKGVVQPILVSKKNEGYELIAGERRWRACRMAGLKEIPALVKEFSEREIFEISLIENIQREDLNPLEEAEAYRKIIEEFNLTQEELSKKISKTRSTIANTLRLLQLTGKVKELISSGAISSGHARAILSVKEKQDQEELAERIVEQKLNVRETEKIVSQGKPGKVKNISKNNENKLPEIIALEEKFQYILGTKVNIKDNNKKGKIEIFYYSLDDLERIKSVLNSNIGKKADQ